MRYHNKVLKANMLLYPLLYLLQCILLQHPTVHCTILQPTELHCTGQRREPPVPIIVEWLLLQTSGGFLSAQHIGGGLVNVYGEWTLRDWGLKNDLAICKSIFVNQKTKFWALFFTLYTVPLEGQALNNFFSNIVDFIAFNSQLYSVLQNIFLVL